MLSVGVYPDVPLKHARDKRDGIRRLIASGIDPSSKREAEKKSQADTFAAIAAEWLDLQRKGFSPATLEKAEWTIKDLLNPCIYRNLCHRAGIQSHAARYAFAQERMQAYRNDGLSEREARAATSLDLGHGDGRGRFIASVYARDG